ncbi:glycosyltransferase family 4 protein [Microbacterium sp. ET2]|uniref:glycosyltransferase family 4 protein n=1 Tax=Microbacterium albipurpureum TaxID=3050384 RepID=UPI00259CCF94|nr:glycosyltransferase family 4 protein [Microbacterium sp. ET2 (Ac-2212)]WJL95085.1 glycosyltransferase family 4 protein [Microbacterium sp. ET2 (Ac-2212)]
MARTPARPRVVIATRLYAPEPSAAGFRMEALAKGLVRAGAEVTVLSTRPPRGTRVPSDEQRIRVRRWPVLRDRSGNVRGYLPYASFDGPALVRMLFARGDVVVAEAPPTTGIVALVASRLRRRPLVYYPGDVWTDALQAVNAPPALVGFARVVERTVVRGASRSLAVSAEVGTRLTALGVASRVIEVGNGVDTDVFRPDVPPADHPTPYFVYTGTMSEWQRPEIFIEALALLEDTRPEIVFLGQGTGEAAVREAADRLARGRVHFHGVVPPSEAARWLRGATAALVSIVPGIGYDFARPTKTYAAAGVGTPVLYAGAAAGAEPVKEGRLGEAVEFDAPLIASAMRRLLDAETGGASSRDRERRAAWARDNVSLRSVGDRAAGVVLSVVAGDAGGPMTTRSGARTGSVQERGER